MQLGSSEQLLVRCDACGWSGVPWTRRPRLLIGPSYVLLAVSAGLMDVAGIIDLRAMITTKMVIAIMFGLPLTIIAFQLAERCGRCGSRKLRKP